MSCKGTYVYHVYFQTFYHFIWPYFWPKTIGPLTNDSKEARNTPVDSGNYRYINVQNCILLKCVIQKNKVARKICFPHPQHVPTALLWTLLQASKSKEWCEAQRTKPIGLQVRGTMACPCSFLRKELSEDDFLPPRFVCTCDRNDQALSDAEIVQRGVTPPPPPPLHPPQMFRCILNCSLSFSTLKA